MTLLWCVTGASLLAALMALSLARRSAKRLEQISQMYWELKYQNGELRVRLDRLAGGTAAPQEPATAADRPTLDGFVSLASIKR